MKWFREDRAVGWIVVAFALSQLASIGWDLPGGHGWENDGIAPRDFFAGIGINLTPGQGHRYPLFHNLIVGILCLPLLVPAALRAEQWTLSSLAEQVLTVPTMTGCSLIAKLVGVTMACVSLFALARIGRRTVSARAGRWAAIWAATCLSFAYYGRVSNLDGPYLMWTVLAIDRLLTIVESRRRRDYVIFGILAGAAVATKDQAYAGFILPGLIYQLVLPLRSDAPFGPPRTHFVNLGWTTLAGASALGVLTGAVFNPSGFLARVRALTGSATRDWMTYERSWRGLVRNVLDIAVSQEAFFWPWLVVVVCWFGVAITVLQPGDGGLRARAFRLLPLCAGLSSVLFFTLVVARCDHRFLLPFGFWLSYYGGVGSSALLSWASERGSLVFRSAYVTSALMIGLTVTHSAELHLTQLGDARHQVSAYLAALEPGSVVETYDVLVHLPHFDVSPSSPYRLQRVSRRPVDERNPLVGAEEIDAPYSDVARRRPDVLVIPEFTAREFLRLNTRAGTTLPSVLLRKQRDTDARSFFGAALEDALNGYEVVLVTEPQLPSWATALGLQPVQVHASVGHRQWILRRTER